MRTARGRSRSRTWVPSAGAPDACPSSSTGDGACDSRSLPLIRLRTRSSQSTLAISR